MDSFKRAPEDFLISVAVKNGCKRFGKEHVLHNFNMAVPNGHIYAVLGSSGSGKTTLLACIYGILKLDHGEIIFYNDVGQPLTVTGKKNLQVGYMPQETALYKDFSIEETLIYFGQLRGSVSKSDSGGDEIMSLINLFDLPNKHRIVGTLSGGQKRRVSLCAALICCQPKSLILLDEACAGIDTALRERVWKYLRQLTIQKQITVIVTTHYIDEANAADTIGLMKGGQLMFQENPQTLIHRHNATSLESVVLSLWKQSEKSTTYMLPESVVESPHNPANADADASFGLRTPEPLMNEIKRARTRISALTHKNFIAMYRNFWLCLAEMILPAVIIYLSCVGYQGDPQGVLFGTVSAELDSLANCLHPTKEYNMTTNYVSLEEECGFTNLSCDFLRELPADFFTLTQYATQEEAIRAIHLGKIRGYIYFPDNYSSSVIELVSLGAKDVEDNIFNDSRIFVRLDQSNTIITQFSREKLVTAYQNYSKRKYKECGLDERQGEFPLKYINTTTKESGFLSYVAPGLAICWLTFYAMVSTAIRFISERRLGVIERAFGGDVQIWEIFCSYLISGICIIFVQCALVHCVLGLVFNVKVTLTSSSYKIFILVPFFFTILTSVVGTMAGFLIAVLCSNEIQAALLTIACLLPSALISAVFWPVEGMVWWLQVISPILPFNLTSQTLRSLMNREWELTHPNIWPGFFIVVVFYVVLTILTLCFGKRMGRP